MSVCGTPSVLVPYPQAKDNHQEVNAMTVASKGAAIIVHQNSNNESLLFDVIVNLLDIGEKDKLEKKQKLCSMKKAMKNMSMVDSKEKLLDLIGDLL